MQQSGGNVSEAFQRSCPHLEHSWGDAGLWQCPGRGSEPSAWTSTAQGSSTPRALAWLGDGQCLAQQQPHLRGTRGQHSSIFCSHQLLFHGEVKLLSQPCCINAGWAVQWNQLPWDVQSGLSSLRDCFHFGYKCCVITLFQTLINPLITVSKHQTPDFSRVILILFNINSVPQTHTLASVLSSIS